MISLFKQMVGSSVENISAVEAQELLRDSNVAFIDVREAFEYKGGHIAKAKNIPVGQIASRVSEINKDKEIIVVCASGARSQRAAKVLASQGFTVKNMSGGMSAWRGKVS